MTLGDWKAFMEGGVKCPSVTPSLPQKAWTMAFLLMAMAMAWRTRLSARGLWEGFRAR